MGVTRRLERIEGNSRSIFEVRLDGRQATIRTGKTGHTLDSKTKTYLTAARAHDATTKLLDEKRTEGYRSVDEVVPSPLAKAPRDAALEAAIRAARNDPAPYLVYADWLQQQGNPYGELIVLAHELETHPDPVKRARHGELLAALRLPSVELARVDWRHGMWSALKLENLVDHMDESFDAAALARRMFAEPACAALEKLSTGVLRWEYNHVDVPAVLALAAEHAWATDLVALALGDVDGDIDMAHHVIGDVGAVISRAFPGLRDLYLHSGTQSWHDDEAFGITGLDLPALRKLVIETCSMSKERVGALVAGNLPVVEELELWFGAADYGATATCADLRPLFDGASFTHVTVLGLRNAEFTDDIARQLGGTSLARRLESLDLSMGTLGDEGAIALAAAARSFRRLQALNVDDNFLTDRGLATLRDAFGNVHGTSQKAGPHRYVSVGE